MLSLGPLISIKLVQIEKKLLARHNSLLAGQSMYVLCRLVHDYSSFYKDKCNNACSTFEEYTLTCLLLVNKTNIFIKDCTISYHFSNKSNFVQRAYDFLHKKQFRWKENTALKSWWNGVLRLKAVYLYLKPGVKTVSSYRKLSHF